jgi:hypothetical protein
MIPPISPRRSPQLTNEHGFGGQYEQKFVSGMPIGDIFLSIMLKAWANQRIRRRESLSPRRVQLLYQILLCGFRYLIFIFPFFPRQLLTAIGQKYDQYLDFAQQDAHEFLRQLLDAMRMEEFDVCILLSFIAVSFVA